MSDPALPAMGIVFNEVCVLVTSAFTLTLLPGFSACQFRSTPTGAGSLEQELTIVRMYLDIDMLRSVAD